MQRLALFHAVRPAVDAQGDAGKIAYVGKLVEAAGTPSAACSARATTAIASGFAVSWCAACWPCP